MTRKHYDTDLQWALLKKYLPKQKSWDANRLTGAANSAQREIGVQYFLAMVTTMVLGSRNDPASRR
jgi:hypothetical protein